MLNILLNDKVGLDIVRSISAVLDRAVYWVISVAYDVVTGLANISIFKDETISEFSIRLYTLIGLFMIFRISFSLINYLINPDNLMDKEKGGGKLIQRIIITFVLIVAVPQAFNLLSEAQTALLEDKVIEKFFLGEQFDDSGNTIGGHSFLIDERCKTIAGKNPVTITEDGKYIAMLIYRPFFQTDSSLDDSIIEPFLARDTFYCEASSVSALLTPDIYNAPVISSSNAGIAGTGDYRVDYWFIISALVGGVVACLMVSFCMDIAVRSIKLAFLQIISPIPIMSYIDPSNKSSMFSKWAKEVGKTWLDLFLRLGSIYFAITIISSIDNIWDEASSTNHKYWVLLFIIIGALIFAKKLPSLIESVFGIKLSGSFNLNPFKKIRDEALFGKQLLGGTRAVGAAGISAAGAVGANLYNNYKNRDKIREKNPDDKHILAKKQLYGAASGFFSGAYNGLRLGYSTGASGKGNILTASMDAVEKSSKDRNLSESLIDQNVVKNKGPFAKQRYLVKDKFTDVVGLQGKTGTTDELKDKLKQIGVQITLSEDLKRNSDEFISRFKQSSSDIFKDVASSFGLYDRSYKKDANGNIELNSNGQVAWQKSIENIDDFLRNNPINFRTSAEEAQFRRDYQSFYNAETQYRESFNEILKLQKQQKKLTSEKEDFEKVKIGAKASK